MQMSNLLGKTLREPPSEADSGSLALLLRAGYISQLMAGAYTFMPLGNRVRLDQLTLQFRHLQSLHKA